MASNMSLLTFRTTLPPRHRVLDYRFECLSNEIHPFGFINVSIATLYTERERRRCHTQMHRLIEVREKALVV